MVKNERVVVNVEIEPIDDDLTTADLTINLFRLDVAKLINLINPCNVEHFVAAIMGKCDKLLMAMNIDSQPASRQFCNCDGSIIHECVQCAFFYVPSLREPCNECKSCVLNGGEHCCFIPSRG